MACVSNVGDDQVLPLLTYFGYSITSTGITTITPGTALAWFIELRYHSSDLSLSTTEAAPSAITTAIEAGSSTIAVATGTSSEITTAISTSAPFSHNLSTGAKAGIGVGVTIALIFALLFAFWVWKRRREWHKSHFPQLEAQGAVNGGGEEKTVEVIKNSRYEIDSVPIHHVAPSSLYEAPSQQHVGRFNSQEADSAPIQELPHPVQSGRFNYQEADSTPIHELPLPVQSLAISQNSDTTSPPSQPQSSSHRFYNQQIDSTHCPLPPVESHVKEHMQNTSLREKEAKKLTNELRELEEIEQLQLSQLARRKEELIGKLEELQRE
jgi:hypothetical protein